MYCNDRDDAVVWLIVDELHPMSRMRRVFETSRDTLQYVNVSRDTLRSMVASQRHNKLLTKGDCSEDELRLELSRDCVDICCEWSIDPSEDVQSVVAIARELVRSLLSWPRLRLSLRGIVKGAISEWNSGPLHIDVCLAKKLVPTSFDLAALLHCVVAFTYGAFPNEAIMRSDEWWSVDENFDTVKSAVWERVAKDPWFVAHDCNGSITSEIRTTTAAMLDSEAQKKWYGLASELWRKVPNAAHLFGPDASVPEVAILDSVLREHGWTLLRSFDGTLHEDAIVFPCYFMRGRSSGRTFRLLRVPSVHF